MDIIRAPHEMLGQPCEDWNFEAPLVEPMMMVKALGAAMLREHGVGLAAPQIGALVRVFVMRDNNNTHNLVACFNPEILEAQGQEIGTEGCLSLPGVFLPVWRARTIKARWRNHAGAEMTQEMTGRYARIFQHEYDHLEGKTIDAGVSSLVLAMARKKANHNRKLAGWPR